MKKIFKIGNIFVAAIMSMTSVNVMASSSDWIAHNPIRIKPNMPMTRASGFSPAQIRTAYQFDQLPILGTKQVIGIVDAYDDPNAEDDLATFNSKFGLPACTTANGCFKKIYASGSKPVTDANWSLEMALDIEWAHAVAPNAKILLVEAANNSMQSLMMAVQTAVANKASVISMSWGGNEFSGETAFDSYFSNPSVTFVAASGDWGHGVIYPAASPNVIAAGGTTLTTDATGNYISEKAWSGSGGGISAFETEPSYQTMAKIPENTGKKRGVPDISLNADPSTGYSVYDSVPISGQKGWFVVGGTSAASPQWAGLIADLNSNNSYNFNQVLVRLYKAYLKSSSVDFHDILSGSNGGCGFQCQSQTGYDYVTGIGTPLANSLLSGLKVNKV